MYLLPLKPNEVYITFRRIATSAIPSRFHSTKCFNEGFHCDTEKEPRIIYCHSDKKETWIEIPLNGIIEIGL